MKFIYKHRINIITIGAAILLLWGVVSLVILSQENQEICDSSNVVKFNMGDVIEWEVDDNKVVVTMIECLGGYIFYTVKNSSGEYFKIRGGENEK